MVDLGDFAVNRFVCPNDRQLCLRAKLQTGWCARASAFGRRQSALPAISGEEQEAIVGVIRRSEQLERVEQERVGRLLDRLEKLRASALGRTLQQCLLCGCRFGLLGAQRLTCADCRQPVCHKCSIDGTITCLCLICSETRDIWKKTGAWFFKALPRCAPQPQAPPAKPDDENDSSDDDIRPRRCNKQLRSAAVPSERDLA